MGRRVFYKEEVNGVVTKHHRFVYDNYLCVQKVDALNNNAQLNLFVWDPTEPVATRPLFTTGSGNRKFFYTCDGNKNVSELVHFETRNGIAAHYDYAPFGAVTRSVSASTITDNTFTTDNPFRFPSPDGFGRIFSSEYHDDTLGLVYYRERERTFHGHYRHYNPIDGRWCVRDILGEEILKNLYEIENCINEFDLLGQRPSTATTIAHLLELLNEIMNITGEYYLNHGSVISYGIQECKKEVPLNTPKEEPNRCSIRKCPKQYCCVILYVEYTAYEMNSLFFFRSAAVVKRPCESLDVIYPVNQSVEFIPWNVYE